MKNNKFILAALTGTVTFFLLGWLVWGTLLKSFMEANSGIPAEVATQVWKSDDQMNFGAMIIAHIAMGLLYTLVLMWAGANSTASGMKTGAIVGLLMAIMWDFLFLGMSNLMTMPAALVDIVASTIVGAIGGAAIGMVLAKGTSTAAA
jgi:hypothetical protein